MDMQSRVVCRAMLAAAFLPVALMAQDVEVDDARIGFQTSGNWSTSANAGYRGQNSLLTTKSPAQPALDELWFNDGTKGGQLKYAAWYLQPYLGYGETETFEVYAWWVAAPNRARDAKFNVLHKDGTATVSVDQTLNGSRWNYLGTYRFFREFPTMNSSITTPSQVRLFNNFSLGDYVSADAVLFVPKKEGNSVVVNNGDANYFEDNDWNWSTQTDLNAGRILTLFPVS